MNLKAQNSSVFIIYCQCDKSTKSPYGLRALALTQKLDSSEFARVILHITKHRGYGNKHEMRKRKKKRKKNKKF
ncbi:CRISPR-associated protein, Csn1 family [Helicobacter fennelliae]|uniref:CRISPR-associated protein, Csn1 family n=1 Tax=Helicobacter fennelliae MRY12-0050 TaxID=1325130 RepID=T1CP12_9HELI|nr:CRISPR-associated protein, Csn1 family [Helicobacter fennelliae]GAD18499.1 CRISPR-associated protein, Csn1 family [Helicobacter fennelliae MRY12-0050]